MSLYHQQIKFESKNRNINIENSSCEKLQGVKTDDKILQCK